MDNDKKYLTASEAGKLIFQTARAQVIEQGGSMDAGKFPKGFPVSLRTLNYARKGRFEPETVNKIEGLRVTVWYEVEVK